MEERNKELEEENLRLKAEIESITETLDKTNVHLKKYTAPVSSKEYYEKNKEECIRRVKEYQERTNYKPTQEQKKEYNKNYRRKEKMKKALEEEKKEEG